MVVYHELIEPQEASKPASKSKIHQVQFESLSKLMLLFTINKSLRWLTMYWVQFDFFSLISRRVQSVKNYIDTQLSMLRDVHCSWTRFHGKPI